jgi:hypothetical protein
MSDRAKTFWTITGAIIAAGVLLGVINRVVR